MADYARLARQISTYTTNSLLTAVVLVAGLGFGRQVLRWWAAESPAPATVAPGEADPEEGFEGCEPGRIRFGDQPWTMRRQTARGDKQAAATRLRQLCREAIVNAQTPAVALGRAEAKILDQLSQRAPVEEEPGQWQLHELDEAFPMVMGTTSGGGKIHPQEATELAEKRGRVVTWGIAVPSGPNAWTLYAFQREPDVPGPRSSISEIPLPPGCSTILSTQTTDGGAAVALRGPPPVDKWVRFFDRWYEARGWRRVGDWQLRGLSCEGRYTDSSERPRELVDLYIGPDTDGQLTGLLMTTPFRGGRGAGVTPN